MKIFTIEGAVYKALLEHCLKEIPIEACGFLSSTQAWHGSTLWPVKNEAHSPTRFLISEATVAEVLSAMAEEGERLTGLYHSHPTARPVPSARDIAYNPYPDLPYLILSLANKEGELCGYSMNEGRMEELEIKIIEE